MQIIKYPNSILSTPCAPIDPIEPSVIEFAENLLLIMRSAGGVGLAAPQIGLPVRIFVVDIGWHEDESDPYVFINPTIQLGGKETRSSEGCLSFPGETFHISRSSSIDIEAVGSNGLFTLHATGFLAIAIQHEYDHIEGKTVLDRLSWLERKITKKKFNKK